MPLKQEGNKKCLSSRRATSFFLKIKLAKFSSAKFVTSSLSKFVVLRSRFRRLSWWQTFGQARSCKVAISLLYLQVFSSSRSHFCKLRCSASSFSQELFFMKLSMMKVATNLKRKVVLLPPRRLMEPTSPFTPLFAGLLGWELVSAFKTKSTEPVLRLGNTFSYRNSSAPSGSGPFLAKLFCATLRRSMYMSWSSRAK